MTGKVLQNSFTCLFTLQGSYGVVKLAYNEDSEQYYVSRDACIQIHVVSRPLGRKVTLTFNPCVQAMKVVSKKKLMRQHGFLRRWKIQTSLSSRAFWLGSATNRISSLTCDFRPPAAAGIRLTQSHAAVGEGLQRDRHPEETGPSQCREAGGGQSDESAPSCSVRVAHSQHTG